MPKGNEHRKNGQVAQPGIQEEPEGNGWPTPLVAESPQIKFSYTDGKSGRVEKKEITNVQESEAPTND